MVNPFDRNFFKFLFGFLCILVLSFALFYIVGRYGQGGGVTAGVGAK